MTNSTEPQALHDLTEVMRLRSRGASAFESRRVSSLVPEDPVRAAELASIEDEIDRELHQFFPAHDAYNRQCLHALRIILDHRLALSDPVSNRAKISDALDEIETGAPRFQGKVSVDDAIELGELLERYANLKSVSREEFPHPEVLGYRVDERYPIADDPEKPTRRSGHEAENNSLLTRINQRLNKIVPDGAYYNALRQSVVDSVLENWEMLCKWKRKEEDNQRTAETNETFIPNGFHKSKEKFFTELYKKLGPERGNLENNIGPAKRLTPAAAIRIGGLIHDHYRLSQLAPLDPGKITAPMLDNVPQGIRTAVRRSVGRPQKINPHALPLAHEIAEMMDDIMPANRRNFASRVSFVRLISENRENVRDVMSHNNHAHINALKNNQAEVQKLAATLSSYHREWTRGTPEPDGPNVAFSKRAKPLKKLKSLASKSTTALRKAGRAEGQQKLSFTNVSAKRPREVESPGLDGDVPPISRPRLTHDSNGSRCTSTGTFAHDERPDAGARVSSHQR